MRSPRPVHGATPAPREPVDRVAWRVRIKSHPTGRAWFRVGVAVVGLGMVIAAPLAGWLPGPGGIPLFLAGLAVLATEFIWAKKLRSWLIRHLRTYLDWPVTKQRLFWAGFFACLGLIQWTYMAIAGVPGWVPEWLRQWLLLLPGVN